MHKTKKFVGQPIFAQLIRIIPKHVVANAVRKHKSDRYYKALPTNAHLISILYGVFGACDSARALCENLTACFRKLNYFGLKKSPAKSTLSDANSKRDHRVFETIYFDLVKHYRSFLSDSRTIGLSFKELFIIDSTTIQLFSNILKGAGRNPKDGGKKKGGLKVHTLMDAAGDFARFVKITSASANDLSFLKQIPTLPPGSCVVFDKAYNNYNDFATFGKNEISFVTRMRSNTAYEVIAKVFKKAPKKDVAMVLIEEHIEVAVKKDKTIEALSLRKVTYQDEYNRIYVFLCNNFEITPEEIALIYKKRWQIELLFKKVKQNFQLNYFYGDTVNAIYIQVWCTLISQLLMTVLKKQLETKKAYSTMISMLRLNLQEYYDVHEFIKNTAKAVANSPPGPQLRMF